MHDLPIEIINYCLLYADTGTKLIYNIYEKKIKMMYDFTHNKYNSLLRLFSQREIQENEDNIVHVHLPWLFLCNNNRYKQYFAANITIYEKFVLWNSHIIYMKEYAEDKISYYIT